MAKPKRPVLADLTQSALPPAPEGSGVVVPMTPPTEVPTAKTKPSANAAAGKQVHTSLYLDPAVHKAIKRIALEYDRKSHDLVMEGIEMMLVKYAGKTVQDIKAS